MSNLSVTAVSSSTAAHVANTSKSLYVKQFVDESLGNSSYLIADEASGEAAVIDPQRDVEKYVQSADGLGLKLKYALDSHLHADFISGAHELAHQLGVPHQHERSFQIGASAAAEAEFEHIALQHGDRLALGNLSLGILSTPGHTPSTSALPFMQKTMRSPRRCLAAAL